MANKKKREIIRRRKIAFMNKVSENRRLQDGSVKPKIDVLTEENKDMAKCKETTKKTATVKKKTTSNAKKTASGGKKTTTKKKSC